MSIYDKASLVLIPSGTKTSKVYSQKPVNGDGDFTFSRSTAATRVNASGNIEKETQNRVLKSNAFDSGTWNKSNVSVTGGQSDKDGGNDAWLLLNTSAGGHINQPQTSDSGQVITISVYAKAGTLNWLRITEYAGSNVWFDLGNGVVAGTTSGSNFIASSITDVGGGWYRCTSTIIGGNNSFRFYPATYYNDESSLGNIYIQDAQRNRDLITQDYIETDTAAVEGGITDNVPRLDYTDSSCPALLLEPQRTNVIENSEYHSGSTYGNQNVSIVDNDAVSPEGLQNAAKIVLNNGTNPSNGGHSYSFNSTSGTTYTISVFAKAGEYRYFTFTYGSIAAGGGHFDLQEGTLLGTITHSAYSNETASIEDYGNGWYRLVVSLRDNSTPTGRFLYNEPSPSASVPNNNNYSSTGDGTSGAYIYGFQLEASASYATSYIPTYGTSVTRNADSYYNNNMASLYDSANGFCLYFEYADVKRGGTAFFDYFSFQQLPNTDTGFRAEAAGANNLEWRVYVDNIDTDLGFPMRVSNIESKRKVLLKVETTGVKLFADGSIEDSQSGYVVIPTLGTLQPLRSTAQPAITQIKQSLGQILYLPVLSDAECLALTTI